MVYGLHPSSLRAPALELSAKCRRQIKPHQNELRVECSQGPRPRGMPSAILPVNLAVLPKPLALSRIGAVANAYVRRDHGAKSYSAPCRYADLYLSPYVEFFDLALLWLTSDRIDLQ